MTNNGPTVFRGFKVWGFKPCLITPHWGSLVHNGYTLVIKFTIQLMFASILRSRFGSWMTVWGKLSATSLRRYHCSQTRCFSRLADCCW